MSASPFRLFVSSEKHPLVLACRIAASFGAAPLEVQSVTGSSRPELHTGSSKISYPGPILRFVAGERLLGKKFQASVLAEVDSLVTWAQSEDVSAEGFKVLEESLSKGGPFLFGTEITLADVAAFAAIQSAEVKMEFPASVARWFASCLAHKEFSFGAPAVSSPVVDEEAGGTSKSAEKKKLKEEAKKAKEAEKAALAAAAQAAAEGPSFSLREIDSHTFGNLNVQSELTTGRVWTPIVCLNEELKGEKVWIRARCQNIRKKSSKLCFITLREGLGTVQAVVAVTPEMVKFSGALSKESVVDVFGEITIPSEPVYSTTQKHVEIQIEKIMCIARAEPLPLQLEDLSRTEKEFKEAEAKGEPVVRVELETRLNSRIIDMRTRANQAIFRMQSGVCTLFREFLLEKKFVEIHTPKIVATASEGGADCFKLGYFGGSGSLAQSPQLYKQMALMGDLHPGVFEIAPVFRAEKSMTHRHMTEYIGLDIEMTIREHFNEVMEVMDGVFHHIFTGLNQRFSSEIEAVREQYPFEDLLFNHPCTRFRFDEAVKILVTEGPAVLRQDISDAEAIGDAKRKGELEAHLASVLVHKENEDIGTSDEKLLGRIIKKKYKTEFYIIEKFPKEVRPFYTMPCPEDSRWTNSYDVFLRGEEIVSGAQRIHDSKLLLETAKSKNVDLAPVQDYVDSFKYGAHPHGGGGVGLERVVMLFLNLPNIRYASMFPRDPRRITP